jgi:hypothetical protein
VADDVPVCQKCGFDGYAVACVWAGEEGCQLPKPVADETAKGERQWEVVIDSEYASALIAVREGARVVAEVNRLQDAEKIVTDHAEAAKASRWRRLARRAVVALSQHHENEENLTGIALDLMADYNAALADEGEKEGQDERPRN